MTLEELKEFLNNLPEDFNGYGVVNGEVGTLKDSGEDGEPDYMYRCDKPIITLFVDEENKEICFLHQTQEEVDTIYGNDDAKEVK